MSRLQLVSHLHRKLADYVRPKDAAAGTEAYELAGRFATLLALAGIFLPFFVLEFWVTGYTPAAIAMTLAGVAMVSSFAVYRIFGSVGAAREFFLASLFLFILWENFFFQTVYSPGLAWLAVLPVVSILLGSVLSGIAWLLSAFAALALHYLWVRFTGNLFVPLQGEFPTLFMVSVAGMILSNFLFVVMVDSARKEAIQQLGAANDAHRHLAERDELTGLFNRRALHQRLGVLLQKSSPGTVVAMIADLDGFKDVNDTYGHDAGDTVIQQIADRLAGLCSEHDFLLARLGGDEFAVVVVGDNALEAAQAFTSSALSLITGPIEVEGKDMLLGMSVGAALAGGNGDASEVMRRADLAMYEAKQQGGNRLCFYTDTMDSKRSSRSGVATELAEAILRRHIEVHYQPIVDAVTREVTGVEALARWTVDGKHVSPDSFIPLAEESGLAHKLGLLVLETACRDAAAWGDTKLSVNISPVQFRSPALVSDVLAVLRETDFPVERLELEVTEGYLIQHRDRAYPIIMALRDAGIKIALDDFGSGYSSIGYLRQYPFDRLKIDKSIVRDMNGDVSSTSIVQATARLAKSLSLRVTAEGVETEEQAKLLRLAGCCSLQGFLFGRPVPARQIDLLLAGQADRLAVARHAGGSN